MEPTNAPTPSTRPRSLRTAAAVAATCIGLGAGGYALASAANGGSTSAATPTPPAQAQGPQGQAPGGPGGGHGWGGGRSDETPLTGDALTKVTDAAKSKVSGATVVRVETDADGVAEYEAHMAKADGTPVTVYVDASFNVVAVR